MNLPNKLTLLRICMIPIFMLCTTQYFNPTWMLVSCIVFSIASATDFFDGYIARKHNLVTDFGKFADPLADKLLTTVAFIYMMQMGACDPIVLVIIIAREFAVSGLRMVAAGAPGGEVIAANMWGKVKTVLQMVVIIAFYLFLAIEGFMAGEAAVNSVFISQIVAYIMCWVVAAITALSGAIYIWDNRRYLNSK